MGTFLNASPTLEDNWRAIILFGKNTASYKFALGHALLSLGRGNNELVRLDELAGPYSTALCNHLKAAPKQGTFEKSTFLQECKRSVDGESTRDELREATVKYGFADVLDAFHNLGGGHESVRFFHKEQRPASGIRLTSEFFRLANEGVAPDLEIEVEGRWRLVETAWKAGVSIPLIETDARGEQLTALLDGQQGTIVRRRVGVTSSRSALNGYQKGHCFHCFAQIGISPGTSDLADVDHVFPHTLAPFLLPSNVNGVWNLVLSCRVCNRGASGKFDLVPAMELVERLHTRNEFLIGSKHPLGETVVRQTGRTPASRAAFLQSAFNKARAARIAVWTPILRASPVF